MYLVDGGSSGLMHRSGGVTKATALTNLSSGAELRTRTVTSTGMYSCSILHSLPYSSAVILLVPDEGYG